LAWQVCQCREERACKDYPADFGCLYLGSGAAGIVAKGHAIEITPEEAIAVTRHARTMGLVHMIPWTSRELRGLGADSSRALELCSCCPCCCISHRIGDGGRSYIDGIVGLGIVQPAGDCTYCGSCQQACPFDAILVGEDGPIVNSDRCKGCGRCEIGCQQNVLQVHRLELVSSYDDGREMIPAGAYLEQIQTTIH